jgi:protein-disulfide isomerase
MILLAATVVWQNFASATADPAGAVSRVPVPDSPILIGQSPVKGNASARVALIEYSDFECPYCAKVAKEIEPVIRRDYIDTGRALMVYKHFPLSIHDHAQDIAEAAWCAGQQGKFWDAHDYLFKLGGKVDESTSNSMVSAVALDPGSFASCLADGLAASAVKADRAEGEGLKVGGTPIFFIGVVEGDRAVRVKYVLSGAKPLDAFTTILDKLLN